MLVILIFIVISLIEELFLQHLLSNLTKDYYDDISISTKHFTQHYSIYDKNDLKIHSVPN